MLRYVTTALALKAFDMNGLTRSVYRQLGNAFGGPLKRREVYLTSHIERGNLFLDLAAEHGLRNGGEELLEIGTGWVHWHSVYHRLFADARISMFDVWDCRQFDAFKELFGELGNRLPQAGEDVHATLREITAAGSFEEVYKRLGLEYFVGEDGSIAPLGTDRYDCIYSFHVLEHVEHIERLIGQMYAALKPGGLSIHQIGIDDHLTHYDASQSQKNYLRFSPGTWKRFFENGIQFQNRLQPTDFLEMYAKAGFVLESKKPNLIAPEALPPVDDSFSGYPVEDLCCTDLTIVHRKPVDAPGPQ